MKRLIVAAAIVAWAFGAVHAQEPRVVRVGTTSLLSDIGLYLADKRGFFKEEGLKVELVNFDSGAKMVAPLGAGDLDAGAGAVAAGLYNAVARGLKLKAIADKGTNIKDYSYKSLSVRKDLIDSKAFTSLADLKGKKVAIVAKGAADESVIHQAVLKAGLTDSDIEVVYLPFPQHLAAFTNKAIDAAISAEPDMTLMERNGVAVRFSGIDAFYPVQQTAVLLANGKFLAEKDVAARFVRAYLRGVREYTATLRDGKIAGTGAQDMVKEIGAMSGIKDLSLIQASTPVYINPNGELAMQSLETELAFFKSKNLIPASASVSDVVDMSLVEQAKKSLGIAPSVAR